MFEAMLVLPIVEARSRFNGRMERKFEVARSMDENPNGLLFLRRAGNRDDFLVPTNDQIEYIGNIKTEMVKEVLTFLLVEGFYNFLDWEYQKETDVKKTILDNGKTRPYSSAITIGALSCLVYVPKESSDEDMDWIFGEGVLATSSNEKNGSTFSNEDEWYEEEECFDGTEENGWGTWDLEE